MRYFIIAGEASGDKHGAKLVEALKLKDPDAEIQAWGGDLMQDAGATINKHYKELAFMGFVEVIKNLRTISKNFKICKKEISAFKPDIVILIDYPGFNLRMAKWLHAQKLKIAYYISPQAWAWKENRVYKIDQYSDEIFVILPFEKAFYKKHNIDVHYVGHPLKSQIDNFRNDNPSPQEDEQVIALLPGSRRQEVAIMTKVFFEVAKQMPDEKFVLAKAPHIEIDFYKQFQVEALPNLQYTDEGTYTLLNRSKAALCTSGTATLETALFRVPQVVCYKGNALSYQIAKRLVKVDYISLVNLIAEKEVVKELIQHEFTKENALYELKTLLPNHTSSKRKEVLEGYDIVHKVLQSKGDPSEISNRLKDSKITKRIPLMKSLAADIGFSFEEENKTGVSKYLSVFKLFKMGSRYPIYNVIREKNSVWSNLGEDKTIKVGQCK